MASITSIHLPRSVLTASLRSLFRGQKFLKLLKWLTVGQEVPEIPLSIGSKQELLTAFVLIAKYPYTSPYTHAFVCVSLCILPHIIRVHYIQCIIYMTEAPRVLHYFSAFIYRSSEKGFQ